MSNTPEKIKKGLEHCISGTSCCGCPYCEECAIASDCNPMQKDLQEYIQQLEEFVNRKIVELFEKIEQLQAERDAAVADLKVVDVCTVCKHDGTRADVEPCSWCSSIHTAFEWRGVTKEDGDAVSS